MNIDDPKLIEACAQAAHEVNRAYCCVLGMTRRRGRDAGHDDRREHGERDGQASGRVVPLADFLHGFVELLGGGLHVGEATATSRLPVRSDLVSPRDGCRPKRLDLRS